MPMGEGFLLLTEEREFGLPFNICQEFGKKGEQVVPVAKASVREVDLGNEQAAAEVKEVEAEVTEVEVVRKPPQYRLINKSQSELITRDVHPIGSLPRLIYGVLTSSCSFTVDTIVGRSKDAEEHPAVCECKPPANQDEPGCQDDCLNR